MAAVLLRASGFASDSAGGDLRKLRQVGVAQHEAHVGMGDQPPLPGHDEGVAGLPDTDRGDRPPR